MIDELKNVMNKASKLPEKQQKFIAEFILNEIESYHTFQSEKLSILAAEALNEFKAGKTKSLDF